MTVQNRRESNRHAAIIKIALRSLDLKQFFELYTENIGKGGVFVKAKKSLPPNTPVRFEIQVGETGEVIRGEARIAWVREVDASQPDKAPGMGLQFTSLDTDSQSLYNQLQQAFASTVDQDGLSVTLDGDAAEPIDGAPDLGSTLFGNEESAVNSPDNLMGTSFDDAGAAPEGDDRSNDLASALFDDAIDSTSEGAEPAADEVAALASESASATVEPPAPGSDGGGFDMFQDLIGEESENAEPDHGLTGGDGEQPLDLGAPYETQTSTAEASSIEDDDDEIVDLGTPLEEGGDLQCETVAKAAAEVSSPGDADADYKGSSTSLQSEVAPSTGALVTLPTNYSIADTVLGIDLGTSNSCVAVIHEGRPMVIPTEMNERTVPSVVSFTKKGDIVVGKVARDQLCIDPKNTIYGSKRFIGRPFNSPIVENLKATFPYGVVPGEHGQVAIRVRDEVIHLEAISAHILDYIKAIAQEFVGLEVNKAVITVPAYYNDNQRQAVKEAGRLAGLEVKRIVNEPTSASLAYGFNQGFQNNIMVFDLGGGTFDVSVLELTGNVFTVIASGGNNFLGGEDFDNAITDYIIKYYEQEKSVEISEDAVIRQRVKQAAEFAKRELSIDATTTVNIPYLKTNDGKNFNLQMTLNRDTLNKITNHLVERTLKICDEVLRASNIGRDDIDEIILVGGQTRMPLVRDRIRQHFQKEPHDQINPDEVVALGAALLGGSMDQEQTVQLQDVISISIGIALPGGRFKPIVKANSPVPMSKSYKIHLKPDQESFSIDIFQGEEQLVKDNEYLGTLLFSDLAMVGEEGASKMNIEFRVTDECILKVIATNPDTGRSEEALMVTYDTPTSLKEAIGGVEDQEEAVVASEDIT